MKKFFNDYFFDESCWNRWDTFWWAAWTGLMMWVFMDSTYDLTTLKDAVGTFVIVAIWVFDYLPPMECYKKDHPRFANIVKHGLWISILSFFAIIVFL